ncbi:Cwf15/Cwc15 cell cycle control protein-domain-containing protein [Pelagophyceae sp. CCMP2097]|nr:Cwf15/Cwc15 cell cycle control protein-domain-containing protein [Pelagophyceae sp. CCMP2097]
MTTAHRPTFTAARAGNSEHGNWSSGGVRSMNKPARDMPTHLVMKYRSGSQLVHEMDSAILKANLDERELELEKIKKEREEERTRREVEAAADALQAQAEASLTNNPLLNEPTGAIKRKWNDDVVFRNQARGLSDSTQKRQFVNDTIRSDFHKRFLAKYIN